MSTPLNSWLKSLTFRNVHNVKLKIFSLSQKDLSICNKIAYRNVMNHNFFFLYESPSADSHGRTTFQRQRYVMAGYWRDDVGILRHNVVAHHASLTTLLTVFSSTSTRIALPGYVRISTIYLAVSTDYWTYSTDRLICYDW